MEEIVVETKSIPELVDEFKSASDVEKRDRLASELYERTKELVGAGSANKPESDGKS